MPPFFPFWDLGQKPNFEDLARNDFIVIAVGFDFLNGFHDAANSIATIVATHVLSPFAAVVIGSQGLPAVKKSEGNTP